MRPHGLTAFVDRTEARARLGEAVERAASEGERHTLFVLGEAGIGKTRLVAELAQSAHDGGSVVLAGRCDEELDIAYQPFVEALEHLIAHAPRSLLAEHVAIYGDSVARLVPTLRAVLPNPGALTNSGDPDRYLLYSAVEGLLAAAVGPRPLVLVIEDLHWADLPTLLMLRRLLTSPRSAAMVVIGTARAAGLGEEHPMRQLLADMHREPLVSRLELSGLGAEDVGELLGDVETPHAPSDRRRLTDSLMATTNGNPFFVTELVRSLVETGYFPNGASAASGEEIPAISEAPAGDFELPSSITETLARRIARLGPDAAACLGVAATVGNQFDAEMVSLVSDRESVSTDLDSAVKAGLLLEVPGVPGAYRFAHGLVERHLYSGLFAGARAELHQRIATALERRIVSGSVRVADLARHWLAAARPADLDKAIRYSSLAGDDASASLAPDEACRWYEVTLELLSRQSQPSTSERCELLIKLGEAQRQAGRPAFRETLLEAAALAASLEDRDALVRATLDNSRGLQSSTGEIDEEKIAACDAALDAVGEGDSGERARLLAMKAVELTFSDQVELRFELTDQALAMARRLQDPFVLCSVLNSRFLTIWVPETHAERLANTVEALEASEASGDLVASFFANHQRIQVCIESGELEEARARGVREREMADRMRWPTAQWYATSHAADLAMIDGDLERASTLAGEAFAVAENTEPDVLACYTAQLGYLAYEQGRLSEFVPMLEQAVQANPGIPGFRTILALALIEAGRLPDAGQLLAIDADTQFAGLARDVTFLAVACISARVMSRTRAADGAAALYTLLQPFAGLVAYPGFAAWGPVDLFLGELAALRGEHDVAEGHLTRAADLARACAAPVWSARASLEMARLDLQRGPLRAGTEMQLQEATKTAATLGLGCILAEIQALDLEGGR